MDAVPDVNDSEHYRKLERLYAAAPISHWFGSSIVVSEGRADVRIPVRTEFHHAAHAVHGSVYFRALDDAAFFAANSIVHNVLVLTVSFTVHFTRPITSGELRAAGRLIHAGGRMLTAEATLVDGDGQLLGHGTGVFTRSSIALNHSIGYA
jgi:uncharacterized protein (TIGR00369 family)